jgi:hypothetical protein
VVVDDDLSYARFKNVLEMAGADHRQSRKGSKRGDCTPIPANSVNCSRIRVQLSFESPLSDVFMTTATNILLCCGYFYVAVEDWRDGRCSALPNGCIGDMAIVDIELFWNAVKSAEGKLMISSGDSDSESDA